MDEREDTEERLANAEATIVALLRNIAALEKVADVLLDHWGEDEEKARRGVQFISDHEVKKLEDDAGRQAEWKRWAPSHMASEKRAVEAPQLDGKRGGSLKEEMGKA